MTARRVLLDGLARDADVLELVSELAPMHPWDDTFPGEVFLRLAADALDWCGASRAGPLPATRPGSSRNLHATLSGRTSCSASAPRAGAGSALLGCCGCRSGAPSPVRAGYRTFTPYSGEQCTG